MFQERLSTLSRIPLSPSAERNRKDFSSGGRGVPAKHRSPTGHLEERSHSPQASIHIHPWLSFAARGKKGGAVLTNQHRYSGWPSPRLFVQLKPPWAQALNACFVGKKQSPRTGCPKKAAFPQIKSCWLAISPVLFLFAAINVTKRLSSPSRVIAAVRHVQRGGGRERGQWGGEERREEGGK